MNCDYLQLHLSLSMDGRARVVDHGSQESVTSDVIDFFLNSVGAKLTDMKDVELK